MTETTVDTLLGGRFAVEQPAKGYRIAVDTLLLAAAVRARSGDRVCELGCGVGGVMLALATRVPEVRITGLELQQPMVDLCQSNIQRNGLGERLSVQQGDVSCMPSNMMATFDHVMMNPPYHDHRSHTVSANTSKRLAHAESDEADLAVWIEQASRCLKEDGALWLIHRADRLDQITEIALRHFGSIAIKPIIAREGAIAKRVIVRAIKVENYTNSGVAVEPSPCGRVENTKYFRGGVSQECDPSPRKTTDLLNASPSFSILSRKGRGVSYFSDLSSCEVVSLAPFILYGDDNRYNTGAEDVLRHAQPLLF